MTIHDSDGATVRLARFAAGTAFGDLPGEVAHEAKRLVLDCIGCAVGGASLDAGHIAIDVAATIGGGGGATILGSGGRTAAPSAAAFANSYLGNVLDADDTLLNSAHPGVLAVFGPLAVAETTRTAGSALLAAVAIGYEVTARVGFSLVGTHISDSRRSGEPPRVVTSGWLGFAPAVGAAKVLDLDEDGMRNVLGMAAAVTPVAVGGLWQTITAGKNMMKYVPYAFLGSNGVLAAQLAQQGFTAYPNALDGDLGYWHVVGAASSNWEILTKGLGEHWYLPQTSYKPYSCGRFAQLSVDLFHRAVADSGLRAEDATAVEVLTFPRAAEDWFSGVRDPETQIDMQFSIPLAVAAAALGSDLGPRWMSARQMQDPRLRPFADKVHVDAHPDALEIIAAQIEKEGRFRRCPTQVTVEFGDRRLTASGDSAWGDPWDEATRMSDDDLKGKFRTYTDQRLRSDRVEEIIDVVFHLDEVDDITAALSPLLG